MQDVPEIMEDFEMLPFTNSTVDLIQSKTRWMRIVAWLLILLFLFIGISLSISRSATTVRADQAFQEEYRGTGNFGFVSNGGGTRGDPFANVWTGSTTFSMTIPTGATIQKARLIWTGKSVMTDTNGVLLSINGTPLSNPVMADATYTQIPWTGGSTSNNLYHETADITGELTNLDGDITFTVSDHTHSTSARISTTSNDLNFGVGVWIVYEHASEPYGELVVYQGLDSFYITLPTPRGPHSLVNCANFTADVVDRVADTAHMVSGVDFFNTTNLATGEGERRERSNAFWYEVGSGALPLFLGETTGGAGNPTLSTRADAVGLGGGNSGMYPLQSYAELEWDTFSINGGIAVPSGDSWVCFQIESGDSQNLTNFTGNEQEASGMWNLYMLRVREEVNNSIDLVSFTGHAAPNRQVSLNWETAVEVNNYGFNLYRSETDQFLGAEKIGFVSADASGSDGAVYQYQDMVGNFGTWYYWLEDIDTEEGETLHGPVQVQVSRFQNSFLPLISK